MAWAFVQSKSAGGTTGTAASVVLTSAPVQGNLLVAEVFSAVATAITMSSTGWTAGTSASGGTGGSTRAGRIFYKIAGASESSTVTATVATGSWVIAVTEYSGIDTTTPHSVNNIQLNGSGAACISPNVTPGTTGNKLVVGYCAVRTAGSWSGQTLNASATGLTEREDRSVTSACLSLFDFPFTYASGTLQTSGTSLNAAVEIGGIAVFNEAAGGGPPPPPTNQFFAMF